MNQYRVIAADRPEDAERQLNELADQGYRLLSVVTGAPGWLYLVVEYDASRPGGRAGTVDAEALLGGIPSQGPTVERQETESELGAGIAP